ncbi:MAG: hypothetical protein EKK51_31015 [Mycolicibacterium sp.]|uniref:hypothetical protein n=1 Tax=Mycolicibacterium sp. TaxID=2320850 RepID=UPI000F9A1656|nr:hypothetical protein [Mycolicibacterium sp.]RUP26152.1 MAG: hypothetical protein EKK51_31015 [Mycolicibacterium sp.]
MTARLDVGAYVVLGLGVPVSEGLEDVLCRVVRVQGDLRDIRRVGLSSGELEGIEVRFLASELRPASPAALRWHDALRVRAALAVWRQAVDDDDEDVDSLASLVEAAEQLAERVIHADPAELSELAVCGYVSDRDGAQVVEIDTTEDTGRVRVLIGEGVIYDGDPNTDEPPGRHYGTRWGSSGEHCDECGAQTTELVSEQHEQSCSLYPPKEVDAQRATGPGGLDDIAARIDPTKARYAVARACAALGRDFDWDAGMFNKIREAIEPAVPSDCPAVSDQSAAAIAFWRNVIG